MGQPLTHLTHDPLTINSFGLWVGLTHLTILTSLVYPLYLPSSVLIKVVVGELRELHCKSLKKTCNRLDLRNNTELFR